MAANASCVDSFRLFASRLATTKDENSLNPKDPKTTRDTKGNPYWNDLLRAINLSLSINRSKCDILKRRG